MSRPRRPKPPGCSSAQPVASHVAERCPRRSLHRVEAGLALDDPKPAPLSKKLVAGERHVPTLWARTGDLLSTGVDACSSVWHTTPFARRNGGAHTLTGAVSGLSPR